MNVKEFDDYILNLTLQACTDCVFSLAEDRMSSARFYTEPFSSSKQGSMGIVEKSNRADASISLREDRVRGVASEWLAAVNAIKYSVV